MPVTEAGGFGLGTLNYGGDKVRITKEFGNFDDGRWFFFKVIFISVTNII